MKKIAIIGMIFCPLLAGCAGGMLEPEMRRPASVQAPKLAGVQAELKALRWRVNKLSKQVARQPRGSTQPGTPFDDSHRDRRLAAVERALKERQPPTGSGDGQAPAASASDTAALAARLSRTNERLEQLLRAQESAEQKLQRLEHQPGGAGSSQSGAGADAQNLAKLEKDLQAAVAKHNQLAADLEKDRTAVIDFLEQLDKRIEDLEKAQRTAPGKP